MKTRSTGFSVLSGVIMLAFMLLPLSTNAQGSKADFTGTWAYNAEKSQAGQAPAQGQGQGQAPGQGRGNMGGTLVVKQEANLLTIQRTMSSPNGERTSTMKYTLDGKECTNNDARGDSKSTATWSADGKKLTIKTTRTMNRNGESRTMTSTEVWSLTGGTLTIETAMPGPNGERKMTAVYNKK